MTRLTEVELVHVEGRIQRWIRFGRPTAERIVDRRRRVFSFMPGAVFAFVRWAANEHGTVTSHIDIVRATSAPATVVAVPGIDPGGDSLLRVSGWARVQRVLAAIDQIEANVLLPEDACPDHWRHVHCRITVGQAPRDYTLERHRAWLARARLVR